MKMLILRILIFMFPLMSEKDVDLAVCSVNQPIIYCIRELILHSHISCLSGYYTSRCSTASPHSPVPPDRACTPASSPSCSCPSPTDCTYTGSPGRLPHLPSQGRSRMSPSTGGMGRCWRSPGSSSQLSSGPLASAAAGSKRAAGGLCQSSCCRGQGWLGW